jgi:hypothetical protein
MTKVKHPVVSKLSKIKDRLVKNPVVHGMGNIVVALVTLSREFYIANDTLHQEHRSRKRRRMRHI